MAFTIFRRFFGGAVNTASGYAIGGAMTPALDPLTQDLANRTWALHPDRPIDPYALAEGVAQGQVAYGYAQSTAEYSGISKSAFDHLVEIANTGPGVAEAFELWRRGLIDEAGFRRAAKREGIEDEWVAAMVQTFRVLLTVSELANAVVQAHRTFDDALADAEKQGYSQADFQTLVDNTGLPPGPETLMAWWRRGIITQAELEQGIREGHTKTKYIPFYEAARAPVLSAAEYAGLRLRGWITAAESYAGGALTGHTQEQMDQLFLNRGRPATTHQVHIGYARGAKLAGAADEVAAIRKAVEQSNIRPEYADLLIASRYTYPSAFVLRGLAQSGAISRDEAEQALLFSGWEPTFAAKVAEAWAADTSTPASENPWEAKAKQRYWTDAQNAFIKNGVARDVIEPTMTKFVPDQATRDLIFEWWTDSRTVLAAPAAPSTGA